MPPPLALAARRHHYLGADIRLASIGRSTSFPFRRISA